VSQSRASSEIYPILKKKSSVSWLCDELRSQLCEIIFQCCWEIPLTKLHLPVTQSRARAEIYPILKKKTSVSWLCDELCSQLCEITLPASLWFFSHKVAHHGVAKPRKRGIISIQKKNPA